MMVVNSTDLKDDNNELYDVEGPPREGAARRYVVKDLGASLGETGRIEPRRGYIDGFEKEPFITGIKDGRVAFGFRGRHQDLLEQIRVEDVRWICERLQKLTDRQLHDAFKAGNFSEEVAARYVARIQPEDQGRPGDSMTWLRGALLAAIVAAQFAPALRAQTLPTSATAQTAETARPGFRRDARHRVAAPSAPPRTGPAADCGRPGVRAGAAAAAARHAAKRQPPVIQTQIILAIVGAVVMLVVGASLARAFGIVGAAGLVRYRAKIEDPKDAGVMLSTLAVGLAAGVGCCMLALFATVFIVAVLWIIESFEPKATQAFALKIKAKDPAALKRRWMSCSRATGSSSSSARRRPKSSCTK